VRGLSIPEPLVEYFTGFIESLSLGAYTRLYRYGTCFESSLWVAYEGFDLTKSDMRKMCTSLSPIVPTMALPEGRVLLIEFHSWVYDEARAVPYTRDDDPITGDHLVPYELELSVYYAPERGYETKFISFRHISKARIVRGVDVGETSYKKAKSLPIFIHGRSYARYPYTLLSEDLLVKQLAITTVLYEDKKMRYAFAYAWDKYWEDLGRLSAMPMYSKAIAGYETAHHQTYYCESTVRYVCSRSFIPEKVVNEILPKIGREIKYIYALVGQEVGVGWGIMSAQYHASERAYRLYAMYPDLFENPEQAEALLKWWPSTYDDLIRYLETLRARKYEPRTNADLDPETIKEDYAW
jgi:hypothetical protein